MCCAAPIGGEGVTREGRGLDTNMGMWPKILYGKRAGLISPAGGSSPSAGAGLLVCAVTAGETAPFRKKKTRRVWLVKRTELRQEARDGR